MCRLAALPGLPKAARRKLAVTSLLTAGRRGATRSWIRARMPAGREKFHALVSCHCSAAWSPDKPRAGRAVSVLDSLALSRRTCSFCTQPHLLAFSYFFSLLTSTFATFHLLSVFSFGESALALNTSASVCFSLVITEESRRQDKSFVTMATALRHSAYVFFHTG